MANDTSAQTLTGSAESGATVTVYDNGSELGATTANATAIFNGLQSNATYYMRVDAQNGDLVFTKAAVLSVAS